MNTAETPKGTPDMNETIHEWNPDAGDCLQGDVILFRLPASFSFSTADAVAPRDNRLILAEGEVTGHHHAIKLVPDPVHFRDDALARELMAATAPAAGVARLYRDGDAVQRLVRSGELVTGRLAIGFLVVEGGSVVLRHDEHDAIRIPAGRYYVGGQQEWDAAEARRVQD